MQHGNQDVDTQIMELLLKSGRAGWAKKPGFPGSILVQRDTGCMFWSSDRKPFTSLLKITFQKKDRINRMRFRFHVSKFEALITHMYLDDKGFVTVGLGHLIPKVADMKNITFLHRGKTTVATDAEKTKNFNLVLNSGQRGDLASEFKKLTDIDIDLTAIEALFDTDVEEFKRQLRFQKYFPDFETYPAGVQLGMLDLAYNMGVEGFYDEYPKFRDALKSRNWIKVADESGREVKLDKNGNPGLMAERNKVVFSWFFDAIKEEPFFLNPHCRPKLLSVRHR